MHVQRRAFAPVPLIIVGLICLASTANAALSSFSRANCVNNSFRPIACARGNQTRVDMHSRSLWGLGWINVLLSTLLFLLSLAPFTPAIALFLLCLPLAVVTVRSGFRLVSVIPVLMWILAVMLAPISLSDLLKWPLVLWSLGLGMCGTYVCVRVILRPRGQ
jgi:hypothetical protein